MIDPADIPSMIDQDPQQNYSLWGICSGANNARGTDTDCSIAFKYGMKRDFNTWLASLGPSAPVKSLTELREWNTAHKNTGSLKYGQSNLDISDEMDLERDRARYEADRAKESAFGTHGIDEVRSRSARCGAVPGRGPALAARPGYPTCRDRGLRAPQSADMARGFTRTSPYGAAFTGRCGEPGCWILYAFDKPQKRVLGLGK